MKNLSLTILLVVFTLSNLFAQVEGDITISDGTNQLLRITDEGNFGAIQLTDGIPSSTSFKLYRDGSTLYFDGSQINSTSGDNDWTIDNNNMYSNVIGNVGVNNPTPNYTLDVGGDLNFSGKLYISGETGNAGDLLISNGPNNPPTWKTVTEEPPSFITYLNQNLDLPGGVGVLNKFNESYDNGNIHDPTNGTFTAPSDGLYHFDCKIGFTPTTAPLSGIVTSLTAQIDGVVTFGSKITKRISTNTSVGESVMFSLNLNLQEDEKVTFVIQYPVGSGLNIASVTNTSVEEATTISGFKVVN